MPRHGGGAIREPARLLWGSSLGDAANIEQQASQACRQLVARKVAGVFFAPLELTPRKDTINRTLPKALDKAGIALVLLDRDLVPYPERSRYDLVGIDNRRAGYAVTSHLLRRGCRRVIFVGRPGSAPTVDARIAGYREAVAAAQTDASNLPCAASNPMIRCASRRSCAACARTESSARTTSPPRGCCKTLTDCGVSVPEKFVWPALTMSNTRACSPFLSPQSTSPVRPWAPLPINTMLERLRQPKLPASDILLNFHLVVRDSCGARKNRLTSISRRRYLLSGADFTNRKRQSVFTGWIEPAASAVLGEVLWDVFDHSRRLGGAPLNFAAHASGWGTHALLISAVGTDSLGEADARSHEALGLDARFLQKRRASQRAPRRFNWGPAIELVSRFNARPPMTPSDFRPRPRTSLACPGWLYYGTLFASTPAGEAACAGLSNAFRRPRDSTTLTCVRIAGPRHL